MPATLTRGTTYAAGSTVNATNLDALLTSATIANTDRTNLNQTLHSVVTRRTTAPPGWYNLECWAHSDQPTIWQVLVSSAVASVFPFAKAFTASGTGITPGTLLEPVSYDAATSIATLRVAQAARAVVAVSATTTASGARGVAVFHGICRVRTTGTVNGGRNLRLSSTNGVAEAMNNNTSGVEKFGVALRAASSNLCWALVHR